MYPIPIFLFGLQEVEAASSISFNRSRLGSGFSLTNVPSQPQLIYFNILPADITRYIIIITIQTVFLKYLFISFMSLGQIIMSPESIKICKIYHYGQILHQDHSEWCVIHTAGFSSTPRQFGFRTLSEIRTRKSQTDCLQLSFLVLYRNYITLNKLLLMTQFLSD